MSDTLLDHDRVVLVDDVLATTPIEPDGIGKHTVLRAGSARVIVMSFDRGQGVKEHRSRHPLLVHALDGHVRVTVDEQTYDLRPGGLLYLPNAVPHSVEAIEPSRVTITPIGL